MTTVSPDNSRHWEPARTCGKAPGKAALPAAAGCPPPSSSRSSRWLRPDPPSQHLQSSAACTSGRSLLSPSRSMSRLLSSRKVGKTGGGGTTTATAPKGHFVDGNWSCDRAIYGSSTGGYCCVRVYSWTLTPGQLGWGGAGVEGETTPIIYNFIIGGGHA